MQSNHTLNEAENLHFTFNRCKEKTFSFSSVLKISYQFHLICISIPKSTTHFMVWIKIRKKGSSTLFSCLALVRTLSMRMPDLKNVMVHLQYLAFGHCFCFKNNPNNKKQTNNLRGPQQLLISSTFYNQFKRTHR